MMRVGFCMRRPPSEIHDRIRRSSLKSQRPRLLRMLKNVETEAFTSTWDVHVLVLVIVALENHIEHSVGFKMS